MPVTETSREAYEEIKPILGKRQMEIYEYLKHFGPANNTMIAASLKRPINSVTPRIWELVHGKGIVEQAFIGRCPVTKKNTIYWKVSKCQETL